MTTDNSSHGANVFAVFEGTLDRNRVDRFFSHQSLRNRAVLFGVSAACALLVFGCGWALWSTADLSPAARWTFISIPALAILGHGVLQQFGWWHGRTWMRWNSQLAGRYRIVLGDEHIQVQTSRFATCSPYRVFDKSNSSPGCVQLILSRWWHRSLLLPVDDCRPPRSLVEITSFLEDKLSRARGSNISAEMAVSAQSMPFELGETPERILFDGPVRQGEFVETATKPIQSKADAAKQNRLFVLIVVAMLFITWLTFKRPESLPDEDGARPSPWPQLLTILLGLPFFALLGYLWWRMRPKAPANPQAEVMHLSGWVSQSGISASYGRGCVALTWRGCDAVQITGDRIVIRFWASELLLLGRHMFSSDAEFEQASNWVRAAPVA